MEIDFKSSLCDVALDKNYIFPSVVIDARSCEVLDEINSERAIYLLNIDDLLEEDLMHK